MRFHNLLFYLIICLLSSYCKPNAGNDYKIRVDFRFGKKFVSIKINEDGKAYAVKGSSNNYTDAFKVIDSKMSQQFTLDSVKQFYKAVRELGEKDNLIRGNITDGMRTEIYYEGKKVYDAYSSNRFFWDLFRPIMDEIPRGYSPFRPADNVFDY
ncbi:hypothetical protein [Mucilaginibacter agri]|uniref:Uncharacterized protein n=1 Tax=Mucilaginibacter agri TaxID=2695265 RepID=A0A966DR91_9SPHI|nr:hypothetical protein [Mucilaginibacter agri]NCD68245.1 hypothetical protein [Mucilaginibacter agri]